MLTFRGSQVHEASPIDVDFVGKSTDLLSRDRMIGSYFTMFDTVPLVGKADVAYNTEQRAIFVYDANADDFRKISIMKALFASMRFSNVDDGELLDDIFDGEPVSGLPGSGRHGDFFTIRCPVQRRWRNANTFGELMQHGQISASVWRATVRSLARLRFDAVNVAAAMVAAGAAAGAAATAEAAALMANMRSIAAVLNLTVGAAAEVVAADDVFATIDGGGCGTAGLTNAGAPGVGVYPRSTAAVARETAKTNERSASRRVKRKKRSTGTATAAEAAADSAPAGELNTTGNLIGGIASTATGSPEAAVSANCVDVLCAPGSDPELKLAAAAYFLSRLKITRKTLERLANADVRLPFGFLLMRPFQRYKASSAILAQGGKDLGVTFHGHHDFQLTDDVIHKTHVGHYTFYSKTVIKNPNRYVIAEDVFCTKYCGGENTTFFTSTGQFEEVATGSCPSERSLLSVIVPHDRYARDGSDLIKNPLDITGRFEPVYTKNLISPDDLPHYPGASLLVKLLDLTRVDWGEPNEDRFNAMYQHLNRVCFQGRQFAYDWKTCSFAVETLESGHWGRSGTYAGCRAAREGRGMLKQPDRESTLL